MIQRCTAQLIVGYRVADIVKIETAEGPVVTRYDENTGEPYQQETKVKTAWLCGKPTTIPGRAYEINKALGPLTGLTLYASSELAGFHEHILGALVANTDPTDQPVAVAPEHLADTRLAVDAALRGCGHPAPRLPDTYLILRTD